MEHNDRDTLLAVVSGVAVGLLALSFPSPVAFLGLVPGVIAVLDLARRRQLTAVGVLLVAASLTAGLPSAWALFGGGRVAGTALPAATAAVFGVACGTLILGVMVLLLEPGSDAAGTGSETPAGEAGAAASTGEPPTSGPALPGQEPTDAAAPPPSDPAASPDT